MHHHLGNPTSLSRDVKGFLSLQIINSNKAAYIKGYVGLGSSAEILS
jgi:hypothetical protein